MLHLYKTSQTDAKISFTNLLNSPSHRPPLLLQNLEEPQIFQVFSRSQTHDPRPATHAHPSAPRHAPRAVAAAAASHVARAEAAAAPPVACPVGKKGGGRVIDIQN